jgi:hypothetical protein
MYCSKCGVENPEEAVFCKNCGFQFQNSNSVKCFSCGNLNNQNTKFCGQCGKLISENKKIDTSGVSYRFFLKTSSVSKKTLFKFLIDKNIVYEGHLIDGFDFNFEVRKGLDNFHLIEIIIVKKGFADFELKDFSQKINFDLVKGYVIEFVHHNRYVPFTNDYFTIKQ